jgi:hypothetical protein
MILGNGSNLGKIYREDAKSAKLREGNINLNSSRNFALFASSRLIFWGRSR